MAPVAAAEATETPTVRPVASVLPLATVAPTLGADDEWFRSEVPLPESQGNFPLGYITVAFDKEFPPYSPVVMLYQERLAEKRGLGVHFVPFDIEDRNRVSETRRGELLQSGGHAVPSLPVQRDGGPYLRHSVAPALRGQLGHGLEDPGEVLGPALFDQEPQQAHRV